MCWALGQETYRYGKSFRNRTKQAIFRLFIDEEFAQYDSLLSFYMLDRLLINLVASTWDFAYLLDPIFRRRL